MADVMSRQQAERIINKVFFQIMIDINSLRRQEPGGDRRTILGKLERILNIRSDSRDSAHQTIEYWGWMNRLDDAGYSEYADMLVTMMYKISYGGNLIKELPSLITLRNMYDFEQSSGRFFEPAGPPPPRLEPSVRTDLPGRDVYYDSNGRYLYTVPSETNDVYVITGTIRGDLRITSVDAYYLARTVYGEVRGVNDKTKEAVAWTIRNRADEKGRTIREVVTQEYQYTAWGESDPNYLAVTNPYAHMQGNIIEQQVWARCREIAESVLAAPKGDDPTQGATHYHDDSILLPDWADPNNPLSVNVQEVRIEGTERIHFYRRVNYRVLPQSPLNRGDYDIPAQLPPY